MSAPLWGVAGIVPESPLRGARVETVGQLREELEHLDDATPLDVSLWAPHCCCGDQDPHDVCEVSVELVVDATIAARLQVSKL